MKRYLLKICCIAYLSVFYLASCEPAGLIGDSLNDDLVELFAIDTFTVLGSTVLLDSIVTSGTGQILVGSVEDDKLGRTTACSFFQIGLQSEAFVVGKNARYDSLVLILDYAYSRGDTNQIQQIDVHQLSEDLEFPENEAQFYNTSSINYNRNPLGSISFKARPGRKKALRIKLSDNLGYSLFELGLQESEKVSDTEDFLDYFKGLALIPGALDKAAILGFSFSELAASETNETGLSPKMRLYYHRGSEELYYDFPVKNSSLQFNQVISDRSNTPLIALQNSENDLSASLTNEEMYIQGATGLIAKIKIPYIDQLLELGRTSPVMYAELIIKPVKNTYSKALPLPQAVSLYETDKKNRVLGELRDEEGNVVSSMRYVDEEFNIDTYYQVEITDYILAELKREKFRENAFLIAIPQFQNSLERLVLGSKQHQSNAIQLKVIYAKFRE